LKRITKAALGGVAGCALVLGGTQAATGFSSNLFFGSDEPVVDLPVEGPFDAASATIGVKLGADGNTNFKLEVTDIDLTAAGGVYGAHLHTGVCDEEDASKAGPHYNHEIVALGVPVAEAEISRRTEVWFDLAPNAFGNATDSTTVSFRPMDPDSIMSIVVHVAETDRKTGLASFRGACFPLNVSGVFPKTVTT
jgi:hypothetical protein